MRKEESISKTHESVQGTFKGGEVEIVLSLVITIITCYLALKTHLNILEERDKTE